jgi:signal transduction histidine kinase
MPAAPALPTPAQLSALAHAALLDQLDHGDPAHALAGLLQALGRCTGRQVWIDAEPCASAGHAADGTLSLPLWRLGKALGRLCLQPGGDLGAPGAALALGGITDTLAALLLVLGRGGHADGQASAAASHRPADRARTAGDTPLRMAAVQTDATGQRLAEAAARAATERLGKIAAHVPGALFQFQREDDGFARFPYISARCVDLFGVLPEALAQDASALLRRVDPAHRAAVMASIDASGVALLPWVHEFPLRRPDGVMRWIRGSATPQREADGRVLWHGYFDDLTEWQALARADHRQRVAEAANRAKNEFLSRMSHELRTPLHAVLGFAQLLGLDDAAPLLPQQQRQLALIRQSGEHLLAMIDDLLDLTSIEARRLPLTLQAVPLRPLADDALAMVQAAAQRPDLALACEGDCAVAAWADPRRLRQVLINLLSNAIKYNRPGGSVRLRLHAGAGRAVLEVHDAGPGLSAAECAQLFEPFNRLGQAHGPVQGTGIGLTVSQGLVQLMGGQITVHSRPGEGSCFSVTLPMPP